MIEGNCKCPVNCTCSWKRIYVMEAKTAADWLLRVTLALANGATVDVDSSTWENCTRQCVSWELTGGLILYSHFSDSRWPYSCSPWAFYLLEHHSARLTVVLQRKRKKKDMCSLEDSGAKAWKLTFLAWALLWGRCHEVDCYSKMLLSPFEKTLIGAYVAWLLWLVFLFPSRFPDNTRKAAQRT